MISYATGLLSKTSVVGANNALVLEAAARFFPEAPLVTLRFVTFGVVGAFFCAKGGLSKETEGVPSDDLSESQLGLRVNVRFLAVALSLLLFEASDSSSDPDNDFSIPSTDVLNPTGFDR